MTDAPDVLDQAVLAELRDSVAGDDAFVRDLVATYLAEAPGCIAAIEEAAAAAHAEAIVRPAHTLKSSSASLGAMRLAQVSREIETAGRENRLEGIEERVIQARAAWQATTEAFREAGLA